MNRTTLEYVLNSMYIAIVSASMSDHQRALANDSLFRCAGFDCAPPFASEILRRIAANAVNQEAFIDPPQPSPTRPRFRVVQGGNTAA
jgi:hypothetical protein